MSSPRRRIPSLAATIGIVWCLGLVWSPAAYADSSIGLPDPSDAVGSVSDTVSDTTDTVSDTVDSVVGTGGSIGDEVDEATGGDTGVGEAVDTVTGVVSGGGDTVDETVDGVGPVVDDVTDTISDTTGGATDPVTDVVDGVVDSGGDVVDGVTDSVDEVVDDGGGGGGGIGAGVAGPRTRSRSSAGDPQGVTGGVSPEPGLPATDLTTDGASAADRRGERTSFQPAGVGRDRLSGSAAASQAALDAFARSLSPVGGAVVEAATSEPGTAAAGRPLQGLMAQAGELARRIAFPLALAFIVAGFLALQNRLDRDDPKLALAPVDQDQEVLYFE